MSLFCCNFHNSKLSMLLNVHIEGCLDRNQRRDYMQITVAHLSSKVIPKVRLTSVSALPNFGFSLKVGWVRQMMCRYINVIKEPQWYCQKWIQVILWKNYIEMTDHVKINKIQRIQNIWWGSYFTCYTMQITVLCGIMENDFKPKMKLEV